MKKEEMKKQLLKHLGLTISSIEAIKAGTARNSYLLNSKGDKYILKLYSPSEKKDIQKKMNYLRKINSKKEIAINPLNKKLIEFGNLTGFVYKFFEGKSYAESKISNKLVKFGKIVGDFNKQTNGIVSTSKSNFYQKSQIAESKGTIIFLKKKGGQYGDLAIAMEKGLSIFGKGLKKGQVRNQLIHGDLHFDNVLYNEKTKKYKIIDVDDIQKRVISWEILVIFSYLMEESFAKNKKIMQEIMKGYGLRIKLSKFEKEVIPHLILLRKYGEITWLSSQNKEHKISNNEYGALMKVSLKQLNSIINQFDKLTKLFRELK